MKFLDALKKVGGGVLKQVFPAAGPILDIVNGLLPEDEKLSEDATGEQVQKAIELLPPDKQAEILSKKVDVELAVIKAHSTDLKTLAEVDMAGASTRPEIALMMAKTVCSTIILMAAMLAYAIIRNNVTMIAELTGSWQLVLALIATPCALLRAYFAMRTKEKQGRMSFASGGIQAQGLVSGLIKAFKK